MAAYSYWYKLLDFFGLRQKQEGVQAPHPSEINSKSSKVVSLNQVQERELVVYNPSSFAEVEGIVDDLKQRKPVILNLEQADRGQARRLIDFISGAVYGLNGRVEKVGKSVFIFTPSNVKIDGDLLSDGIKFFD
ncbi:MAG: cell division protein SepF [Bacillota bacterium]